MTDMCTACLCYGRKLHFLGDTGLYDLYATILHEIKIYDISCMVIRICWECRATLGRFEGFKEQVKRSYMTLMQNDAALVVSKPPRLQIHRLEMTSYPPYEIKTEQEEPVQNCLDGADLHIKNEELEPEHQEPEAFINVLNLLPPLTHTDMTSKEKRSKKTKEKNSRYKKKLRVRRKCKRKPSSDASVDNVSIHGQSDVSDRAGATETEDRAEHESEACRDSEFAPNIDSLHNDNVEINEKKFDEKAREKKSKLKKKLKVAKKDKRDELYVAAKETEDDAVPKREENGDIDVVNNDCTPLHNLKVDSRTNGLADEALKTSDLERPQCTECGKTFSSKKTYRYHMNVLHRGQNRYPCPRCGKIYQWKSNLGRHMRTHKARDADELYCSSCEKRFASVATFRQHLRISRRHVTETEFSFMCNECGKKFVNKTRLRDHIDWEHLNKIKFRCQLCNKAFKCHTSLYVHLQNVHRSKDKKDNLCHVCGKSYQNAAKLKYHIVAMHTSETPYRCAHCAAAFGWYSSLYRHVREVHYKMKVQPKKKKLKKLSGEVLPHMIPQQIVPNLHQTGQL